MRNQPAATPSSFVAPGTTPLATAPAGAAPSPAPFSGVYWPLVSHNISINTIDQAIPANTAQSFDAVGSVMYCYECSQPDVFYKLDDGSHEQPLGGGTGIDFLFAALVFQQPIAFKRITIINKSPAPANIRVYYGFGIPSEYKDVLRAGQNALPVADAALQAIATSIRNDNAACCSKTQTALSGILDAINGLADAIAEVISKITITGGNTMIPYPTYAALAAAVTAGMQPATLAQVVIATATPPTLETWQLRADESGGLTPGDTTQAAVAGIIIPEDYAPGTNARIWYRV